MHVSVYSPSKVYLLHWQAANCVTLSEISKNERAKRLLRLLAADLLLEAERQNALLREHGSARRVPIVLVEER
jgi:hypothetical protein